MLPGVRQKWHHGFGTLLVTCPLVIYPQHPLLKTAMYDYCCLLAVLNLPHLHRFNQGPYC